MHLAYTMTLGRGQLDPVLSDLAQELAQRGKICAGIVQTNTDREGCKGCDMDVLVLPDGPTIRISQFLGAGARGCKLDSAALETAVGEVQRAMGKPFDVFLLNKFGKQEALGKGFRDLIAEALARDAVVVTGVNPLNVEALEEFTGGACAYVKPSVDSLADWITTRTDQKAA